MLVLLEEVLAADNVTPTNHYLPFGPRDAYNTNFRFSASFNRSGGTSRFEAY